MLPDDVTKESASTVTLLLKTHAEENNSDASSVFNLCRMSLLLMDSDDFISPLKDSLAYFKNLVIAYRLVRFPYSTTTCTFWRHGRLKEALLLLWITWHLTNYHRQVHFKWVKMYDLVKQWQKFSSNMYWIFYSFSIIIWQLPINPIALSWISKHVYWTINCQQCHTKWNVHF